MTLPNRTEPAPTTYFGLPVERGGVPLKAIQAREFWPRWWEIMGAPESRIGFTVKEAAWQA